MMKSKKDLIEKPVNKKLTDKNQQLNLAYALINAAKVALIRTMDSETKQIMEKLVGWKITEATATADGESFGFIVKKGKKERTVWVDCDPEGNGMGHLDIKEYKACQLT